MANPKVYGLLAEFPNSGALYHAAEKVRDAGYSAWDCHSPFPVHGLEKAMGVPRSKVPYIVAVMAFTGATLGFSLQYWTSTTAYAFIISAKPFNSYQAFVPVTFELGILLGSFGAVFGMLGLNRLPQLYHSLFKSDRFAKATDDGFFISIESRDPKFDADSTRALLEAAGATAVEEVED